jgi:hypothetical protein
MTQYEIEISVVRLGLAAWCVGACRRAADGQLLTENFGMCFCLHYSSLQI